MMIIIHDVWRYHLVIYRCLAYVFVLSSRLDSTSGQILGQEGDLTVLGNRNSLSYFAANMKSYSPRESGQIYFSENAYPVVTRVPVYDPSTFGN